LDELKALLEGLKPRPKTVLTNGVFDILHAGHASYLEAASNLGDILIVALNDDASALALKGKDRPVLKLEDRLRLVASFRWVDYVTWFSELKLDRVLEALRPDIHAKGVDYGGTGVPEARLAKSFRCSSGACRRAKEAIHNGPDCAYSKYRPNVLKGNPWESKKTF